MGPGVDEPLVWYEGAGLTDKRFLAADERGSVTAVTDASGNVIAVNRYDEYGIPANSSTGTGALYGRFGYTGQAWLPSLGLYHFKARAYSPTLGRFMQTDPIGYADGVNWYDYVKGDPVNNVDPSGLDICPTYGDTIVCTAQYTFNIDEFLARLFHGNGDSGDGRGGGSGGGGGLTDPIPPIEIRDPICDGPYETLSLGLGGTAAAGTGKDGVIAGHGLGVNINFSRPVVGSLNPFKGLQISISLQTTAFAGAGAYIGGGAQGGVGFSPGAPSPAGFSGGTGITIEGDVGLGGSEGASVSSSDPFGSGFSGAVGGRSGLGIGGFIGAGKTFTGTLAFKPIGC